MRWESGAWENLSRTGGVVLAGAAEGGSPLRVGRMNDGEESFFGHFSFAAPERKISPANEPSPLALFTCDAICIACDIQVYTRQFPSQSLMREIVAIFIFPINRLNRVFFQFSSNLCDCEL